MNRSPAANDPGPNDDVPWAMRYTLPVAALAVACLVLFVAWLFTF